MDHGGSSICGCGGGCYRGYRGICERLALIVLNPTTLRAATGCTQDAAALYADPLGQACAYYGINTPARLSAFLAQLAHESGSLRHVREVWGPTPAQERYEGRRDLGNVYPGDGEKFKGHGLIQVTGRSNHAAARDRLREAFGPDVPDFERDPESLMQPRWACLSAADWWAHHGCNAMADAGDIIGIGRLINRGSATTSRPANGEADRLRRWEQAKSALGSGHAILDTSPAAPEQPTRADSATDAPTTPTAPEGLPMIPIPGLLIGLASSLIQAFAPLAREKVEREIARHTDNPAVAEQVATAVIDAAKSATGQADPIAAVAAVKADPAAQAVVQESTLDHLARMGPVLDRLAAMDAAEWGAEESSRTAAAARAAAERNDPAMLLTYASIGIVILLIVFVGAVAAVQIIKAGKADTEVWAALTGLIGWATAKSGSIYDYRFGTSRSSSAKDVIIGELSSRNRTPAV